VLEIRCDSKKHGEVTENSIGIFERICDSRFCKTRPNEVSLHVWNLEKLHEDGTIKPINTKRFKRPEVRGINK